MVLENGGCTALDKELFFIVEPLMSHGYRGKQAQTTKITNLAFRGSACSSIALEFQKEGLKILLAIEFLSKILYHNIW